MPNNDATWTLATELLRGRVFADLEEAQTAIDPWVDSPRESFGSLRDQASGGRRGT